MIEIDRVVKAIRGGHDSFHKLREALKGEYGDEREIDRALQKAKKKGLVKFAARKWTVV